MGWGGVACGAIVAVRVWGVNLGVGGGSAGVAMAGGAAAPTPGFSGGSVYGWDGCANGCRALRSLGNRIGRSGGRRNAPRPPATATAETATRRPTLRRTDACSLRLRRILHWVEACFGCAESCLSGDWLAVMTWIS